MGDYHSLIMGLIQGGAEFLPISSSGHLALAKIFLGTPEPSLAYDLLLHLATVLATILYFAKDIAVIFIEWGSGFFNKNARSWGGWRFGWAVIISTGVTAAIALPLKPFVEQASQNSLMVSTGLLITGVLLVSSKLIPVRRAKVKPVYGLLIGAVQGCAVFPGVSRSGSTIVAGLCFGLSAEEAFRFSFLMSIPAIIGANIVEFLSFKDTGEFISALPQGWLVGFVCAFAAGFISLCILKKIALWGYWWLFGLYCLLLGGAVMGVTLLGV